MICQKDHSNIQDIMESLPEDQGGAGRHKCAACAYERGYDDGISGRGKSDTMSLLNSLPESQAGAQRHKSPIAAYSKGYDDGVNDSYNN